MIRRNFLRKLTATAAGLLVADDALAMMVEPRRKYWAGWTPERVPTWDVMYPDSFTGLTGNQQITADMLFAAHDAIVRARASHPRRGLVPT